MNELWSAAGAFVAGVVIGLAHFGGLLATARRFARVRRPVLLALGSVALRSTLSLVGFYFVVHAVGTPSLAVAASLAGFVSARQILTGLEPSGAMERWLGMIQWN